MIRGQAEFGADIGGLQIEKLPHHEYASDVLRQVFEAHLEQLPELLLTQRCFGRRPWSRLLHLALPGGRSKRSIR